jgi:aryl-alcohol dehydrogenase-like predicted oxidoreductase
VVGRALKDFPRDSYVLATKVFFPMGEGPNDRGLSREHIMEQCHASLRRVGTDYIDLYQCHRYDPETSLEETLRALDNLVTQGKVLYVGVSEWSATQIAGAVYLARALNLDGIVSNQPIYNERAQYRDWDDRPSHGAQHHAGPRSASRQALCSQRASRPYKSSFLNGLHTRPWTASRGECSSSGSAEIAMSGMSAVRGSCRSC